MSSLPEPGGRLDFPATRRNQKPIAEVLERLWDSTAPLAVLELAAGSGQHAAFFAQRFPNWTFQPSDLEPAHLESIEAYRRDATSNILPAIRLDVASTPWPVTRSYGAIFAINLIHISPWSCTQGLFSEGKRHLVRRGGIFLYGAFRRGGRHTAPSNEAFDAGLRQRDSRWGVRCLDEVSALAGREGFRREQVLEMPANNLSVFFRLK